VQPRRIGLVSLDEIDAARLADVVRVSMRGANHMQANRPRRNRVGVVRRPLGVEPRAIEAFDHAAEVLRSARTFVDQRAERAGPAGMTDERRCHKNQAIKTDHDTGIGRAVDSTRMTSGRLRRRFGS
jgi:hypothetical protein